MASEKVSGNTVAWAFKARTIPVISSAVSPLVLSTSKRQRFDFLIVGFARFDQRLLGPALASSLGD